jgi:hypothetical protein
LIRYQLEYCTGRTFRTRTLPVPVCFLPVPCPYPYVSYLYPARTRIFDYRLIIISLNNRANQVCDWRYRWYSNNVHSATYIFEFLMKWNSRKHSICLLKSSLFTSVSVPVFLLPVPYPHPYSYYPYPTRTRHFRTGTGTRPAGCSTLVYKGNFIQTLSLTKYKIWFVYMFFK